MLLFNLVGRDCVKPGMRSSVSGDEVGSETQDSRRMTADHRPLTTDNRPAPFESPGYDVDALRQEEFPWTRETIYLDHASIGPLPERTRRAVEEFTQKRARPYLLRHDDMFGAFARARELCAQLINADVEEIGLATNTTFGISVAARGLPFRSGDIVLVSDREFPANVYPWLALRNLDVTCEMVPVTSQGWPDEERLSPELHRHHGKPHHWLRAQS